MGSLSSLKGISEIGKSLLNDQLEHGLVCFYDYACLNVGGFFNVNINQSGAYGGDASQLRLVKDNNFDDGRIYEPYRQGLMWESGLSYGIKPIQISGVYVDGSFQKTLPTGAYAHYIDYALGRVVFNDPVPAAAVVEMEYSFKWINWSTADCQWYRDIQFNSFRVDDPHFLQSASGSWATLSHQRLQLPAVIVEAAGRRQFRGYALGGGQIAFQDVFFHIFAEDHWTRKQLIDLITYQNEKTIHLIDKNIFVYPLTDSGTLVANPKGYSEWINETGAGGYFWKTCRLSDMTVVDSITKHPFYGATARCTTEVVLSEI